MLRPLLLCLVLVSACASPAPAPPPAEQEAVRPANVRSLVYGLQYYCGRAFEGAIVANEPTSPNDPFVGRRIVMHVRDCEARVTRVALHVGEDRSRTWVLTLLPDDRLELKHDHRHLDGSEDALSQYGGIATPPADPRRVEFPADAFSRDLFVRQGIPASAQNVWAMQFEPGQAFFYELSRPGRLFRIRFDLTRPVEPPA